MTSFSLFPYHSELCRDIGTRARSIFPPCDIVVTRANGAEEWKECSVGWIAQFERVPLLRTRSLWSVGRTAHAEW